MPLTRLARAVTGSSFSVALRVSAIALALTGINAAHGGMFDDEEARKQILQLRSQVSETQRAIDQRVAELEAQSRNRSIIDLFNQVETLKTEFARLRGQIEVLQNEMENTQKRQRDLYVDLDGRLRKMEAAMVEQSARAAQALPPIAGAPPVLADPSRAMPPTGVAPPPAPVFDPVAEQRAYDQGLEHFRAGRFGEAVTAFQLFIRNFPKSTLVPSAQYWIGNSLYAVRDFRAAIAAQRQLLTQFPDSAKASDALLNIASAQGELGDLQGSRATMQEVIAKYPTSEAGVKAKQRLGIR